MKKKRNNNLKVEILLATMHQKDFLFLDKMNIQSDVLVINQCDEEKIEEIQYKGYHIKMISTKERGLSRSRNMALKNATGDICLIADDDVSYYDNYVEVIQKAYREIEDADIITFCAERINKNGVNIKKAYPSKITKKNRISVGNATSYEIAVNRKSIKNKKIKFDERFGTGSGAFFHGEENIFLRDCLAVGLKAYFYPAYILKVYTGDSTWFTGYDEKFFYDAGAICERSFGNISVGFIIMTVIRKYNLYISKMSCLKVLNVMLQGRKEVRELSTRNRKEKNGSANE